MKQSTKIIILLIVTATLLLIFYPVDVVKKKDINGYWSLDKVIINDYPQLFPKTVLINNDKIFLDGSDVFSYSQYSLKRKGNDSISICCKEQTEFIKDSFIDLSNHNLNFEGTYKINLLRKIIGGGKNAFYDKKLEFRSKNKTFFLSSVEKVKWNEGPPFRGRLPK